MSGMHAMTGKPPNLPVGRFDRLTADDPQVTDQHDAIFRIAMELADTWHGRGDAQRIRALLEKLGRVLESHFRYEERIFAAVGYPRLEEHKAEHKVILDELKVIRGWLEQMGHGTAQIAPSFSVNNFILGVTVGHIGRSDMEFSAFAHRAEQNEN